MGITGFDFAAPELQVRFYAHAPKFVELKGLPELDLVRMWRAAVGPNPSEDARRVVLEVVHHLDDFHMRAYSAREIDELGARIEIIADMSWLRSAWDAEATSFVVCGERGSGAGSCGRRFAACWQSRTSEPLFAVKIRRRRDSRRIRESQQPGVMAKAIDDLEQLGHSLPSEWGDPLDGPWREGGALSTLSSGPMSTHVIGGTSDDLRSIYRVAYEWPSKHRERADVFEVGECRKGHNDRQFSLDRLMAHSAKRKVLQSDPVEGPRGRELHLLEKRRLKELDDRAGQAESDPQR